MRTTLNIDDDILEIVKEVARVRKISVGEAVTHYLRKALEPVEELVQDPQTGWWSFPAIPGHSFGLKEVQEALDEEDQETAAAFFRRDSRDRRAS